MWPPPLQKNPPPQVNSRICISAALRLVSAYLSLLGSRGEPSAANFAPRSCVVRQVGLMFRMPRVCERVRVELHAQRHVSLTRTRVSFVFRRCISCADLSSASPSVHYELRTDERAFVTETNGSLQSPGAPTGRVASLNWVGHRYFLYCVQKSII